jgi:hypothetical protein
MTDNNSVRLSFCEGGEAPNVLVSLVAGEGFEPSTSGL